MLVPIQIDNAIMATVISTTKKTIKRIAQRF